jgi:predicted membrane-bound dolichyl-phosphate-mannose-protein mannosyltransferase
MRLSFQITQTEVIILDITQKTEFNNYFITCIKEMVGGQIFTRKTEFFVKRFKDILKVLPYI